MIPEIPENLLYQPGVIACWEDPRDPQKSFVQDPRESFVQDPRESFVQDPRDPRKFLPTWCGCLWGRLRAQLAVV